MPLPDGRGTTDEAADQRGLGRLQADHSRRHSQIYAHAQGSSRLTVDFRCDLIRLSSQR